MDIFNDLANDNNYSTGTTQSDFLKGLLEGAANKSDYEIPTGPNRNMGKDEFLKLLLTQLQYQDPTNPMDDRQFISEMAQFTALEQMTSMNQNFAKYTESQSSVFSQLSETLLSLNANSQVSGLFSAIGKYISIEKQAFSLKEGRANTISMFIPENSTQTQMRIYDSNGSLIRAEDLGVLEKGEKQLWQWDGKGDNGVVAPDGDYKAEVFQKDSRGIYTKISSEILGYVYGVIINDPEGPKYRIGDTETISASLVKEVTI